MVKAATAKRHAETTDILAADIGLRIRQARQERGMTLAQVGGDDLSRSFLSLVESGRSRISLRALAIVAQKLDLPISHFLQEGERVAETATRLVLDEAEIAQARQQFDRSLSLLDQLPEGLAGELGCRAAYLRGRALRLLDRATEAIGVLQTGLPLAEDSSDASFRAQYRYLLGASLYHTGSFGEALQYLRQALEVALAGPEDPILLGRILVVIGHVHYVQKEIDQALHHYQRATALFGGVRDLVSQGSIYSGMSQAFRKKGDLDNALKYSQLSVGVFRAANRAREMAGEMLNVATSYEALGQLDEALAIGQEGLARARDVHADGMEGIAHGVLASIYLKRGELDHARAEAEFADGLTAEDDCTPAQATGLRTLADIAELDGDHDRADRLYRHALTSLQATGQTTLYASTALAYSLLLRGRGDLEHALEYALAAAGN